MIYSGGRVRSKKEFLAIFQDAGLKWRRTIPTAVVDCELIHVRKRIA